MKNYIKFFSVIILATSSLQAQMNNQEIQKQLEVLTKEQLIACFTQPTDAPCIIQKQATADAQALLRKAILNNSSEEINTAIKAGANVNQIIEKNLPLAWAILLKNTDAVETLLKAGAKPNIHLMRYAKKLQDTKSLLLLIKATGISFQDYDTRRDAGDDLLFYQLDHEEDFEGMLFFFQNGGTFPPRKNAYSNFLYESSFFKKLLNNSNVSEPIVDKILEEFLKQGFDINQLWMSVNSEQGAKTLLKNKANPNYIISLEDGEFITPLVEALISCDITKIKLLIQMGADVNQKVNIGIRKHGAFGRLIIKEYLRTPLALLLSKDFELRTSEGSLYLRDQKNEYKNFRNQMIRILMENGAVIEFVDNRKNGIRTGTLIKTPAGYKPVEQLKENDMVFSCKNDKEFNSDNCENRPIIEIAHKPLNSYLHFDFTEGSLNVGSDQNLITSDGSISAQSLLSSQNTNSNYYSNPSLYSKDSTKNINQRMIKVTEIKEINETMDFYTITVGEFNNYLATQQDILINN